MSETQPIEAQVIPEQAVAIRTEQQVMAPGLFGATEPSAIIAKAAEVATALKQVVMKQGLVSNISGKQYPRCEAWTLLGTMLGVFPVLVWTKQVPDGWEARVEARTKDGAVVGAAEAECLRTEKNWSNRDDFALRSMAQTRATAKCLRMPLGFVMTLSGFEATPAEEMVADHPQKSGNAPGRSANPPPPSGATHPKQTQPRASSEQKPRVPADVSACRDKFIKNLEEGDLREKSTQFCIDLAWLLPTEKLEDLADRFVPMTKEHYVSFLAKVANWSVAGKAEKPYEPHYEQPNVTTSGGIVQPTPEKPIEVPRDENIDCNSPNAPWRSFPVPYGKHAGVKLAELDKNVLWGFWYNHQVQETWVNEKGQTIQVKPEKLAKDLKFREMLDEAGEHYEFQPPAEDE